MTPEQRARVLQLADFIESRSDVGFDMATYFTREPEDAAESDAPSCGTAGCVAGFCNLMLLGDVDVDELDFTEFDRLLDDWRPAAEFLMLDDETQDELFHSWTRRTDRAHAVRVLRRFADTGEVDWEGAK